MGKNLDINIFDLSKESYIKALASILQGTIYVEYYGNNIRKIIFTVDGNFGIMIKPAKYIGFIDVNLVQLEDINLEEYRTFSNQEE